MMQRNRSCRSAARCQDQCCLHAPYLGCHEPTAALPGFVGEVVREVVLRWQTRLWKVLYWTYGNRPNISQSIR